MIKVRMVQMGITTRCNSNCYFCFREELQRRYGFYEKVDLPVEAIERLIDQGIRDIHFCGNRGEAIYHPEIEKILDIIKSNGCRFEMNTNGGRFDTNWWYDLGQKMVTGTTNDDEVIFALDGLKETHEYYRNTNWTQVINNMQAFIKGGGKAVWQMVVFKHNEHQVNLIKGLAKAMGCSETWIINSRLYDNKYKRPTKEYNKTKTEIIQNSESHKIRCKFYHGERVYIDVHGKVWPCCYTRCHFGFPFRFNNSSKEGSKGSLRIIAENEKRTILNTPLNDIVNNSELFKRIFDTMYTPYDKSKGKWMMNYACHLHCNDTNEMNKNRRKRVL